MGSGGRSRRELVERVVQIYTARRVDARFRASVKPRGGELLHLSLRLRMRVHRRSRRRKTVMAVYGAFFVRRRQSRLGILGATRGRAQTPLG